MPGELRVHDRAGHGAHQAVDNDEFARFETLVDHTQAVRKRPELHGALLDLFVASDHQDIPLPLVHADGIVRDEQGLVLGTRGHAHPHEETGAEQFIPVFPLAAHAHRARAGSDAVVHEVHESFVRKTFLVLEPEKNRHAGVAGGFEFALVGKLDVVEDRVFVHVHVGVEGIDGDHAGEHAILPGGGGLHQVADCDVLPAGAPRDGRSDVAKFKVELGRLDGGLGHGGGTLAAQEGGRFIVEVGGGGHVLGAQILGAVEVGLPELLLCLRLQERAVGVVQIGLVRARINGKEQVALFDDAARLEIDAHQVAADPRANLDAFDGIGAPDVFVPFNDLAFRGRGDRHLGRRSGGRCHRRVAAREREQAKQHREQPDTFDRNLLCADGHGSPSGAS